MMMLLAVLQAEAKTLDIDSNLEVIESAAKTAAAAGAELLLTPELFLVGYEPLAVRTGLDPRTLPVFRESLADIAAGSGIGLVYSLPAVRPDGEWQITATLLGAKGTIQLEFAKVHLFGDDERKAFAPANAAPGVVDFNGIKTSLLICFDAEFPETVTAAAVRGAELVLVPTALSEGFESVPQVLLRARALESQIYLAYANHCGSFTEGPFLGGSIVVGPDGSLLAVAEDTAALLFAEVGTDAVRAARDEVPYLRERRPELYASWEGGARESGA